MNISIAELLLTVQLIFYFYKDIWLFPTWLFILVIILLVIEFILDNVLKHLKDYIHNLTEQLKEKTAKEKKK